MNDKPNAVDPQDAIKTLVDVLFTFDTLTIHKRRGTWTVKIHNGSKWIVKESPNIFVAAFLAAAGAMK